MISKATTVNDYLEELPDGRKEAVSRLVDVIRRNLPEGFSEGMGYGMPAWTVPHSLYPPGYHCNPKLPLPFLNLASQKNYISIYHMGLYGGKLLDWLQEEWKSVSAKKPELGKSCLRFKNPDEIPYELIGKLVSKISPKQWIEIYEKIRKAGVLQ